MLCHRFVRRSLKESLNTFQFLFSLRRKKPVNKTVRNYPPKKNLLYAFSSAASLFFFSFFFFIKRENKSLVVVSIGEGDNGRLSLSNRFDFWNEKCVVWPHWFLDPIFRTSFFSFWADWTSDNAGQLGVLIRGGILLGKKKVWFQFLRGVCVCVFVFLNGSKLCEKFILLRKVGFHFWDVCVLFLSGSNLCGKFILLRKKKKFDSSFKLCACVCVFSFRRF